MGKYLIFLILPIVISKNSFCQSNDENYYLNKIENSTSASEISKAIDRYNEYLSGSNSNINGNLEKKKNLLKYDKISLIGDKTCGWALNKIGEYGYIDANFNWKFKLPYHSIGKLNGFNICEVRLENDMGSYYNFKTQELITTKEYNMTEPFSNGRACVAIHGNDILKQSYFYGFIDENGREVIPLIYEYASSFSGKRAMIKKNSKLGIVDLNGNIVVPIIYTQLGNDFSEGIIGAEKDEKFGYISIDGKLVVPFNYDYTANGFVEGMGKVVKGSKIGFVNANNEIVIPIEYDKAANFFNGIALVAIEDNYFLIDKTGRQISENYSMMRGFSEGFAAVSNDNKWGYINKRGKLQIPLIYDGVDNFENGLAFVFNKYSEKKKWGMINIVNQVIIPLEYDEISNSQNLDLFEVRNGDKWGILDAEGKVILPINFDLLDVTNSSFIMAKKKAKYGWINSKNEILIPFIYDDFYTTKGFDAGLILVQSGGKWGIITKNNTVVQNMQYDEISYIDEDTKLARVKQNSKYGYINSAGKLAIPIIYDNAGEYSYMKKFEVFIGDKKCQIDINGNILKN